MMISSVNLVEPMIYTEEVVNILILIMNYINLKLNYSRLVLLIQLMKKNRKKQLKLVLVIIELKLIIKKN